MPRARVLLLLATVVSLTAACASSQGTRTRAVTATGKPAPKPSATASATPTAPPVDPASVHANELGLVPVLMYHQIVAKPAGVYDQTPAHFRAELETLARDGYVPITAADFAAHRIDIPAGKHPVVLTFDDGTTTQLELTADGKPKPGTAVAIMEGVAAEHPGFTPTATFYVNTRPFADPSGKTVRWLHEHGYEVGVHTVTHANLRNLSDAGVQQEIGANQKMIETMIPGYRPTTFALPFGVLPRNEVLDHKGTGGGTSYSFDGVYLVGSNPSHSPFHRSFDPFNIPRIRSEAAATATAADRPFISDYYLGWLQQHPAQRYTSDGNPSTVSFPKSYADVLAPAYRSVANPY